MWTSYSIGSPALACANDESPASLELRTCRLATCVLSRLRRVSILGFRRKRNSNFERNCTGCKATCVTSCLRQTSASGFHLRWKPSLDRLLRRLPAGDETQIVSGNVILAAAATEDQFPYSIFASSPAESTMRSQLPSENAPSAEAVD
jgi:hypothetical protein